MVKTKSKISKITTLLVKQLEDRHVRVKRLILFGSYANGKAKSFSDIDVAVISPSFAGKSLLKRQEVLGEAIFPLKEPIEAIGYTPSEYKNTSPFSFLSEIISTGKVIYSS